MDHFIAEVGGDADRRGTRSVRLLRNRRARPRRQARPQSLNLWAVVGGAVALGLGAAALYLSSNSRGASTSPPTTASAGVPQTRTGSALAQAVAERCEQLLPDVNHITGQLRRRFELGTAGQSEFSTLSRLAASNPDEGAVCALVSELLHHGSQPVLLAALGAAAMCGHSGGSKVRVSLMELLSHSSRSVGMSAAFALQFVGSTEAELPAIVAMAKNHLEQDSLRANLTLCLKGSTVGDAQLWEAMNQISAADANCCGPRLRTALEETRRQLQFGRAARLAGVARSAGALRKQALAKLGRSDQGMTAEYWK